MSPDLILYENGVERARKSVAFEVVAEAPPAWTPRGTTITGKSNPPYAPDTAYIDCTGVSVPIQAQRITVVGSEIPTSQLKGVIDVWIGGHPDALMNAGPRSDGGDLLQIKRGSELGRIPEDVTVRYVRFHDVTRPAGKHSDGIQVMAGYRVAVLDCVFERVNVQPLFFRDAGQSAWGGPITDCEVRRCVFISGSESSCAINVAGNAEVGGGGRYVPARVLIDDIDAGGKSVVIDRAAYDQGCRATNVRGGAVQVAG